MIKNMDELNKKFDGYQFRDQQGHNLLNCVDFIELTKDAETLSKARAVLAEHREVVEWAKDKAEIAELTFLDLPPQLKALVALADALEGGGDE